MQHNTRYDYLNIISSKNTLAGTCYVSGFVKEQNKAKVRFYLKKFVLVILTYKC